MSQTEKFIIDTNILISSVLIQNSIAFQAIQKARSNGALVFSTDTFLEFELVLFRKKFDKYFSKEERLQIVERFYHEAVFVPVSSTRALCRDPKDDKFLNLAIDANASCIVTGDQDLLVLHPFEHIPVLLPTDFLNVF